MAEYQALFMKTSSTKTLLAIRVYANVSSEGLTGLSKIPMLAQSPFGMLLDGLDLRGYPQCAGRWKRQLSGDFRHL